MPCAHGRQESGLLVCSLPTFGTAFHFYQPSDLRRMIAETVARRLAGRTPQQLSRLSSAARGPHRGNHDTRARAETRTAPTARKRPGSTFDACPGRSAIRSSAGRFSAAWQRERRGSRPGPQTRHGEKANVVLVGEHGSGKSTLLVNAVRALERSRDGAERKAPAVRHRYWLTSASRLIAGMKYLGEWQQRCELLIGELSSIDGVLCVDDLLELLLVGGTGPAASVGAFFLPYLQNGELRMAAETGPEELDACRHLLPGLADVFRVLKLEPMEAPEPARQLAAVAASRTRERKGTPGLTCRRPWTTSSAASCPTWPCRARRRDSSPHLFDEAKEDRAALRDPPVRRLRVVHR